MNKLIGKIRGSGEDWSIVEGDFNTLFVSLSHPNGRLNIYFENNGNFGVSLHSKNKKYNGIVRGNVDEQLNNDNINRTYINNVIKQKEQE